MQQRTSTAVVRRRTLAVVTLAVTLMALSNRPALADSDESGPKSLVGAWSSAGDASQLRHRCPIGPAVQLVGHVPPGWDRERGRWRPRFCSRAAQPRAWRVDA